MIAELRYPFSSHELLRRKKSIRRALLEHPAMLEKRIAILGGSTTAEVKDMLELFLLSGGIRPVFYESDYNRFYEDGVFETPELKAFAPEIVYIHTTSQNILHYPRFTATLEDVEENLRKEFSRFKEVWDSVTGKFNCTIIQNNFELPHYRILGNLDAYDHRGRTRYVAELNRLFSNHAQHFGNLLINDINYLSAWFGLERWHDKLFWYSFKYAMNYEAIPLVAHSIAAIVLALYGRSKKCLVLDLDNTLWGGVIGDDGIGGIEIGSGSPHGEAFTEFQQYVKALNERGIILAVSSKNEQASAHEGLSHQDSILKLSDFLAFRANWEPKPGNIRDIARELNIGMDSLVFVDDNPAEREIVRIQEPEVTVPELGETIAGYINVLDKSFCFETVSLSHDDLARSRFYVGNAAAVSEEKKFADYDEFLASLDMRGEIRSFSPDVLDRITQLINKTNQFNLTTRRYSFAEVAAISEDDGYVTCYGRLRDKFSDHGLISVIIGRCEGELLHLDAWLMSCRVLKRTMEVAMFDLLAAAARTRGLSVLIGYYLPTPKNAMVSTHYRDLGFVLVETTGDGMTVWKYDLTAQMEHGAYFIEVES